VHKAEVLCAVAQGQIIAMLAQQPKQLTFMHIMAKMRRLFWPSESMPILQVCSRPVMPYLPATAATVVT
jgi:hypothetical protein